MKNMINEYVGKSTWRIKENANETYSLSGLSSYISGRILEKDYVNKSPIGEYHKKKWIHIHDAKFGELSSYCNGLDLNKLLTMGLINPSGASSRPAKHFDSLMSQMVNMLYISQQEFAGAQAFSNVDTAVAPFIAKDKLNYDQVKQIIQRTIYDINYPLRSGYQTPFINFSFDLKPPNYMKDEYAVIGGELTDSTYSEFQDEIDVFNMAFLDVMMEGNLGRPFTFPIPTYSITKDFDWDSPVTDRLFQLTAKFGLPYFSNYISGNLDPDSTKSMCCRLSLSMSDLDNVVDNNRHGLWDIGASTGSIAVTTINFPRLGYLAGLSENPIEYFYDALETLLEKCYEHHEWKRSRVEWALENGLMPFTAGYISSFKTYFSTIGTIGMNEMCMNMFHRPIYEYVDFVKGILIYLNDKCKEFTRRSNHLYNLEEIPAEGLSYNFAKYDKIHYPNIYTQGKYDGVYYTNSSHCAVDADLSPIENILTQSKFKSIYSGGTLHHLFMGEAYPASDGIKDLIRNICYNFEIPYLAFTKSYAICEVDGMVDDLSGTCPICGGETEVFSRVTGYYRSTKSWNAGKKSEFRDRKQLEMSDFK